MDDLGLISWRLKGAGEKDSAAESDLSREARHGRLIPDACSGRSIGGHIITLSVPHRPMGKTALNTSKNLEV